MNKGMVVAAFAAGIAAGLASAGSFRPRGDVCPIRQKRCLIFWKHGGREFMGGAVEPCEFAREYAQRGNREQGKGSHWVREVQVDIDVDLLSQCLSPEAVAAEAKGVPAAPARRISTQGAAGTKEKS